MLWLGKEKCAVTWEPAGNVPDAIIEEFERGTMVEITDQVTASGLGQEMHTLTVTPKTAPPSPAKLRPVIKQSEG